LLKLCFTKYSPCLHTFPHYSLLAADYLRYFP
jgi:hypothetical protein